MSGGRSFFRIHSLDFYAKATSASMRKWQLIRTRLARSSRMRMSSTLSRIAT